MLKSSLREVRGKFAQANIATIDAELLAAHVIGVSRMQLHAQEFELSTEQSEEFEELVNRRLKGEPVQYLTGSAPFRYLELDVGPGVLIPRPETELLVDAAMVEIERIQSYGSWRPNEPTSVVDLGAGSGAIAISIALESNRRGLKVSTIAVEVDTEALSWLKQNVAKHDVDVRVVNEDVSTALDGIRSDIVIANPPYIPNSAVLPKEVVDFEPSRALFGGERGIEIPLQFIGCATRILKPSGFLALEHHETQGEHLEEAMRPDYFEISHFQDLNQRPRWITGRRRG